MDQHTILRARQGKENPRTIMEGQSWSFTDRACCMNFSTLCRRHLRTVSSKAQAQRSWQGRSKNSGLLCRVSALSPVRLLSDKLLSSQSRRWREKLRDGSYIERQVLRKPPWSRLVAQAPSGLLRAQAPSVGLAVRHVPLISAWLPHLHTYISGVRVPI